jgi:hypothetical protein
MKFILYLTYRKIADFVVDDLPFIVMFGLLSIMSTLLIWIA